MRGNYSSVSGSSLVKNPDSGLISIFQPVSLAARRTFWPLFPIAREKRTFERAFSMQIDDEVYNKMEEEIENA